LIQNFFIKDLILGFLVILFGSAAFWLWYEVVPLIIDGQFNQYQDIIRSTGGLVVSAVVFGFATIFVKNNYIIFVASTIAVVVPFFFLNANSFTVGAVVLVIFLTILSGRRIRKDFSHSLDFSVTKIARAGLPLYFTAASLIIATFYLAHMTEEKAISGLLPRSVLEFSLEKFSAPISSFTGLPKLTPHATLDEILFDVATTQLKNQGIRTELIPKKEILNLVSTQRKQLSDQFGIELPGNQTITDVFYTSVDSRIRDLLGPYKAYLPIASAVIFFFAFKTLTFPLYIISVVLLFLLIHFLKLAKIIKIEKATIEVERLTL